MAYTAPQIGTILLKADRTMYKIGQIAYENMFAEDNEALDYERDVIFIYKKAVEFADDFFVGTDKLDKVVERLAVKISAYDYGELNPIYADVNTVNIATVVAGAALNDLTDVTITNLLDNQLLRYNAATGQWINVGPGAAVRNSQAFTATDGQTVFTTSYPFDSGLFDLYVNGVKLNSLSYTTMGEYQITLNDPCIAGDIIDVVIYDPNTGVTPAVGSLNDLTDVSIGPLANNQALYYNSVSGLWENGLTFVPYTGASASVDLGEYQIRAGQFVFDQTPTGTAGVGVMRWNDADGTVDLGLKGGNVTLQVGQEQVARVVNKTGANLLESEYKVVKVSSAQGQRLAVDLAQANNDNNSADTLGIVTENISNNQEGFITTMGTIRGIDTTGSLQGETWTDGDVLYLSGTTAGAITNVKPTAPLHIVVVGYVEYAHQNNGKIFVKVMNGWEIDELHNVLISSPSNNQGLFYNSSNSLWENKSIATALGYTPANAATTITINGVTYDLSQNRSWTVAAGISGSGASGQVTYWTGASAVSGSNTFAFTPTSQLFVNNSVTAASAIARGVNLTPTLVASANNDILVGLDVNPTFNNGAFTGINNIVARFTGARGFLMVESSVNGNNTAVQLNAKTSTGTIVAAGFYNIPSGTNSNYFTISGDATATHFNIHKSGNVVLQASGTPPDAGQRLQVYGDTLLRGSGATSATTALTVQNSSSTNLFTVRNDGFVNITNTLASSLSVNSSNFTTRILINNTNATPNAGFELQTNGVTNWALANYKPTATTNASFVFYNQRTSTDSFFIDGDTNNVGINTNAPTVRLDVRGDTLLRGSGATSATTALTVQNSSSTNLFTVRNDGICVSTGYSFSVQRLQFNNGTAAGNFGYIASNSNGVFRLLNAAESDFTRLQFGGTTTAFPAFQRVGVSIAVVDATGTGLSNLIVGGTTDSAHKFQVYGDTLLRGSGATSATTALTVQNSSSTNLFRVRNDGRTNILGTSFDEVFNVQGNSILDGNFPSYQLRPSGWGGAFSRFYLQAGVNEIASTTGDYTIFTNPSGKGFSFFISGIGVVGLIHTSGNYIFGGGSANNDASAIVNIVSTTKGFLPPRMTTTEKNAIATPAAGLVVYDTTDNKHYGYDGTTWNAFY